MKILINIPKDKYDLICLSAECGMGGFAFQYIADGQIVEDDVEEQEVISHTET